MRVSELWSSTTLATTRCENHCSGQLCLDNAFVLIDGTHSTSTSQQQSPSAPTLPPATKDPQAVSIVNQTLSAAGGTQAVKVIASYIGTGNVTQSGAGGATVQGTVTVRGEGLNKFRMDTTFPSGERSEVIDGKTTTKDEHDVVTKLSIQPPLSPARLIMPYLQLNAALTSINLNVIYKGVVEIGGRPTQDVQVQRIFPVGSRLNPTFTDSFNIDFFIDSSTFQIVMMQDVVQKFLTRQIQYSDFQTVGGVLVPFSISESIRGQNIWLIQLGQISFNSGVQDSDFKL